MIDVTAWMKTFLQAADRCFGHRVWFVGLQGSYGRGEATETSDLDVVMILDTVSSSDLQRYREMLDTLPHREKICGFFSGKQELLHWEPADLFQFYQDTLPFKGSLDELLPLIDEAAVNRAVKLGACNLYHGCVHNLLHEKSNEVLLGLYKSAVFVVQALYFKQTGVFVRRQTELLQVVSPEEQAIVAAFLSLKNGEATAFEDLSERLFVWSQKQLTTTQ